MPGRKLRFLFASIALALNAQEFSIPAHYAKHEYHVAMRDGVHLFTAVYTPKDMSQKYPILLTRTPYGVEPYGADKFPRHLGPSPKFAEDKFIFVYQDVRGRFMSEGKWMEMRPEHDKGIDESTDTYDTIDWLLKNIPNNNGKVGLTGVSYPGFYASAGMINAHPALLAVSPQAPVSDLYMGDDAYHNGAFCLNANFSFYVWFGKQHNPTLPEQDHPFEYGPGDGYSCYLKMGRLITSETYFHPKNPYWNDIVKHTAYDEFWRSRDILPHLTNVKPAVLVVGGWFDAEDLAGTLKTFRALASQSPRTVDKLVMGPWSHGGWGGPSGEKLGNVSFGSKTSPFFQDEIELPFFDHYLKGAPDPGLPVAYVFETGKNVWHKEAEWPPARAERQRFYLHAHGRIERELPAERSAFDQYVSDPAHPVPSFEKPTLIVPREYMDADQRFVEHRPDVLTYETEPLARDLTVAGPLSPSLFVSTSGTDSDFVVKVIDVAADGREQLVRGEPFRGKFRESFEHPRPFKPGEVQQIRFSMPDVYHCFQKSHRLMVQIQSSWFPLIDRNPQTFTKIPTARPSQFVKATERIYRSSSAASFLEMNVVP